jgi:hypothetical protein
MGKEKKRRDGKELSIFREDKGCRGDLDSTFP